MHCWHVIGSRQISFQIWRYADRHIATAKVASKFHQRYRLLTIDIVVLEHIFHSLQLITGTIKKGASSWLSALPIKVIGWTLNKQKFMDAICKRYECKLKGIPIHCAWGETNSVDHSLICKLGGYTSMRHNSVRYYHAQIMREVCRDIQTKPTLLPINKNDFERKVKSADKARLDISVKGLWKSCEKHSLT